MIGMRCVVALVALLSAGTATAGIPWRATPASAAVIDNAAYEQAQQLVDVGGGRRLNLYCSGSGSPTVVFDSGLGDSAKAWGLVQPAVARFTRACSYDRAGLGFSDPALRPGTSANAADDLHSLLDAARIAPPLILVGHSYGGMNVRLYTKLHRADVAGLVLVDPSMEDLGPLFWHIDGAYFTEFLPYIAALDRCAAAAWGVFAAGSDQRQFCTAVASPRYSAAINAVEQARARFPSRQRAWTSEMHNFWFVSGGQLRAARGGFGDLPLILLHRPLQSAGPRETAAQREAKNQILPRLRQDMADESDRGRVRQVVPSGHYIQHDQPAVVIAAIRELVDTARGAVAPP